MARWRDDETSQRDGNVAVAVKMGRNCLARLGLGVMF